MSDQDEPYELAPFQQRLADLLAALRTEAHLTQQQVADRIGYSRTTVAGAETNHRQPGQAFWTRADALLAPHGELRAAYAQLAAARHNHARQQARWAEAKREARVARWRAAHNLPALPPAAAPTATTPDPLTAQTVEHARGGIAALSAAGWNEWALHGSGRDSAAPRMVGAGDVLAIRSVLDALTTSDRQFGSGPARAFATGYLTEVVWSRLNASGAGAVVRDMFGVATEFLLRVAAMHLDAGELRSCRSLLRAAGSVAEEADDLSLSAWVLARRGELEVYENNAAKAAAYTAAAAVMAVHAPPSARAFILTKHALALSSAGDAAATREVLGAAGEAFNRAGSADEPTWMRIYGWGHLRHDEGRCYANLGLGAQAADAADDSMHARSRDRYPRPHAFSLGIQAIGHAQANRVDQACASGHLLVAVAAQLDSHRVRARLTQLLQALGDHVTEPAVRELREAARPVLAGSGNAELLT